MNRRELLKFAGIGCCAAVLAGCSKIVSNNKAYLLVEESLCIGCGECVTVCDWNAITLVDNKAWIDPGKCGKCGKCVRICPEDAIH